jgi:RNA polymerase sigma factor (TIGR02999 family)
MVNDEQPQDLAGDEPDRSAPVRATGDVTLILSRIEQGEPQAAEQLLPLVYEELRKLAAAKMAQEKPGQTLQATALVHEAYIRLVDVDKAKHWDSRGHFFAAAAEAMRRILVDNARRKKSERHGGDGQRLDMLEIDVPVESSSEQILVLDGALDKLAGVRSQAATLVKMRLFAGLTNEEAALAIGISPRTARRLWVYARAWLRRELDSSIEHNC